MLWQARAVTDWTRPDGLVDPTLRVDSATLSSHMRAAAILGLGCSAKNLEPFQTSKKIDWRLGMPAAPDQADIILVFGGDGTIHRHLSQLVRLGLPVLVVPRGSGNDFARALGLRQGRDALAAWRRFCAGQDNIRAIDLGVITGLEAAEPASQEPPRYFCSVAGVGLDAEVSRRAQALPRWLRGHGGYALMLAPALFRFAPLPMRIYATDEAGGWKVRSHQPTLLAAFANTAIYGGGMKIAPQARMDDGQLDVCVIGGIDPFRLACLFPTVYFGRHLRIREVNYFQAARLLIETETALAIYADGEYVCHTPAEVRIERGAVKVVRP
jgi:diacylglycerol kinase (ATP)